MHKYLEIIVYSYHPQVIEAIANDEEGFRDIFEEAMLIKLEGWDRSLCRIITEANNNWLEYLSGIAVREEVTFLCFIRATWLNEPEMYEIRIDPDGLVLKDLNVVSILTSDPDKAWSFLEMVEFDDVETNNS